MLVQHSCVSVDKKRTAFYGSYAAAIYLLTLLLHGYCLVEKSGRSLNQFADQSFILTVIRLSPDNLSLLILPNTQCIFLLGEFQLCLLCRILDKVEFY